MATVIFDFDSTLVSCESLEEILAKNLADKTDIVKEIETITELGIRGKISFAESLRRRLELAVPTLSETMRFGEKVKDFITFGMKELIRELQQKDVEVWIVSGGLQESLVPVGMMLNIPESQIYGVRLLWSPRGDFLDIDEGDPFSHSKVEGVKSIAHQWNRPRIGIGDAMSDYRLYEMKLVDEFILFTEHFRCQEILEKGTLEAKDVEQLRKIIYNLLENNALFRQKEN